MTIRPAAGLGKGGRALWRDITEAHPTLDAVQLVQLTEACRAKDRLDKLDDLLRGDISVWADVRQFDEDQPAVLIINQALAQANATANLLKQLLAAMRLADSETGARPQQRGGARGAYTSGGKATETPGRVSSLEAARQRAAGA